MSLSILIQTLFRRLSYGRVILLFGLLVLPAIFSPYHSDDYFHLLLLGENPAIERDDASLWGLFSFIDDNPAHRQQMQRYGVLPWFAAEDFYFRFWRPVTELTHWVDYRLFGVDPLPAHIHSVAWFLLLAFLVWRLARHTLQEAGLPLLVLAIFLWDGQHVANVGWIATRNAMVAAVFTLLALYAHMQWRERNEKHLLLVAILSWVLALAGGESAVGLLAYLFFYAILLDGAGGRKGLVALVPYLLVFALWLALYQRQGFGVNTSAGLYINPMAEPTEYVWAVLQRIPVYVAASLLPIPAGLSWVAGQQYEWVSTLFFIVSMAVSAGFLFICRESIRNNRVLAFWLFSSVLALLPVCSTMAQDRLALMQTIGMDMVIAILVYPLVSGGGQVSCGISRALAVILLFIHLLLSPLHLLAGSVYIHWGASNILDNALALPDEELQGKNLLVLRVPIGEAVSLMGIREVLGRENPQQFLWLANDESEIHVTAIGQHEMLVEKPAGFTSGFESAFRSVTKWPFLVGQVIDYGAAQITIRRINPQGYPDLVQLKLEGPGDWLVYTYSDHQFHKAAMPEPGSVAVFR